MNGEDGPDYGRAHRPGQSEPGKPGILQAGVSAVNKPLGGRRRVPSPAFRCHRTFVGVTHRALNTEVRPAAKTPQVLELHVASPVVGCLAEPNGTFKCGSLNN